MLDFKTIIQDSTGADHKLNITIGDKKQSGYLQAPFGNYEIINVKKIETGLTYWMVLSSFNMKGQMQLPDDTTLVFLNAGYAQEYTIDAASSKKLQHFLESLNLPMGIPYFTNNLSSDEIKFTFSDHQISFKSVYFYLGKRPTVDDDIFRDIELVINGEPYPTYERYTIPGDQGIYIPIGIHESGKELHIEWKFETGYVSTDRASIAVGIFRNHFIANDRTNFKYITVESFEDYAGEDYATV